MDPCSDFRKSCHLFNESLELSCSECCEDYEELCDPTESERYILIREKQRIKRKKNYTPPKKPPPPPPKEPSLISKILQESVKYLRFSYSIVNKGWNSEYVTTGDPNKDLNINNSGSTYAQYGFQFKQQLWSMKNIEVLSKTDANIGAIYRVGPTLFESSTGIDFMKDEYSCGSGIMWSFGEFTSFYRIGYNNITATFITSEYGNRLMFGIVNKKLILQ